MWPCSPDDEVPCAASGACTLRGAPEPLRRQPHAIEDEAKPRSSHQTRRMGGSAVSCSRQFGLTPSLMREGISGSLRRVDKWDGENSGEGPSSCHVVRHSCSMEFPSRGERPMMGRLKDDFATRPYGDGGGVRAAFVRAFQITSLSPCRRPDRELRAPRSPGAYISAHQGRGARSRLSATPSSLSDIYSSNPNLIYQRVPSRTKRRASTRRPPSPLRIRRGVAAGAVAPKLDRRGTSRFQARPPGPRPTLDRCGRHGVRVPGRRRWKKNPRSFTSRPRGDPAGTRR